MMSEDLRSGCDRGIAAVIGTHVKEGRILITAQATSAQQAQDARDAFDRFGGADVRAYDRTDATNATRR